MRKTLLVEKPNRKLQGGQNFFEKIRTKIRTFSQENRTIRTIFEKNPYYPYNFRKKIRTIRTLFLNKSVQFSKKSV